MAEITPARSQENVPSSKAPSEGGEDLASSPILPTFGPTASNRPRKPPTITPRSFTRFFTPKSSLQKNERLGKSRKALRDITASASNRKGRRTPSKDNALTSIASEENHATKRQKIWSPSSSDVVPDQSSPLKRIHNQSFDVYGDESEADVTTSDDEIHQALQRRRRSSRRKFEGTHVVTASRAQGRLGWRMQQEIAGPIRKPGLAGSHCRPATEGDWQYETSNFFTRPEDTHLCVNPSLPTDHSLPYCVASCNTNTLIAIGDEDGSIRLLESAQGQKPGFNKAYVTFRPHINAILDLAFSPDDMLLATASGDQTSQVIDMPTQRTTHSMAGHFSSVKQVRFQPGSTKVIATSSRDGSVQIWDLRCKGTEAPARDIRVSLDGEMTMKPSNQKMVWAKSVNAMIDAHASRQAGSLTLASSAKATPSFDAPSKSESPGRRGDVSITALSFLTPDRDHLLLTSSEANASVKLWDLRTTHNGRRNRAVPLSSMQPPESHNTYRNFGLTSLSLSGNGSRFYALCRDNTVYAYSTAHLILGHAPELSKHKSKPRRSGVTEKEGLGPIYGFRHPNLHVTSFYVKSSLRPAKDDKSEILAVGSSDGCVVVFPTDERYMTAGTPSTAQNLRSSLPGTLPGLTRTDSGTGLSARLADTIPIYQHGSALVRAHRREVTGSTWTPEGELVSLSDDFYARCWRQGPDARDLRLGGEKEGRRWGCGWAEVEEGWDDDDE